MTITAASAFHFALLPQRREEARAELQPDGEYKEDQPEVPHEIQRAFVYRFAEVAGDNAGKEHACRAQADTAHLETAERHTGKADQGEHGNRVSHGIDGVELEEPVHAGPAAFTSTLAPVS
jgi:hypothetical protein